MYSIKLYVYIYVHVNVLFVVSLCYIDTNQNNQMKLKSSRLRQVSQSLNVHRNELVVTRTLIYLLILSGRRRSSWNESRGWTSYFIARLLVAFVFSKRLRTREKNHLNVFHIQTAEIICFFFKCIFVTMHVLFFFF